MPTRPRATRLSIGSPGPSSPIALALAGLLLAAAPPATAAMLTFTSAGGIAIPDTGPVSPYPSTIDVSGLDGPIVDVNVSIRGLAHTFPGDLGALLVGPDGRSTFLFDGPGAGTAMPITGIDLIFDDSAADPLPCFSGLVVSGAYRPGACFPGDVFPAPAPAGPHAISLAIFDGLEPTGTWRLFVHDFAALDGGQIEEWSLTIATRDRAAVPGPPPAALLGLGMAVLLHAHRRRRAAGPAGASRDPDATRMTGRRLGRPAGVTRPAARNPGQLVPGRLGKRGSAAARGGFGVHAAERDGVTLPGGPARERGRSPGRRGPATPSAPAAPGLPGRRRPAAREA